MKKLILMRHAKSSWQDQGLDDHARPLNARGKSAAKTMGKWLKSQDITPDLALVSSAQRTTETWSLLSPEMGSKVESEILQELYLASPVEMLAVLNGAPSDSDCLLMISHQPGTSILAQRLSDGSEPEECARAYRHFPTAGMAILDFQIEQWSQLEFGIGKFVQFVVPKDIAPGS